MISSFITLVRFSLFSWREIIWKVNLEKSKLILVGSVENAAELVQEFGC